MIEENGPGNPEWDTRRYQKGRFDMPVYTGKLKDHMAQMAHGRRMVDAANRIAAHAWPEAFDDNARLAGIAIALGLDVKLLGEEWGAICRNARRLFRNRSAT